MSTWTNAANERRGAQTSRATVVRPLGAFERLYHRYMERNPMHHMVVAEFETVITAGQARAALDAVQRRHPLLSAHIEDHPDSRLGFYRTATLPAVDLTVLEQDSWSWERACAREFSRPFNRSVAPLLRATLIEGTTNSTIVLSFDHTIADGISATFVLKDLVAALNGHQLEVLPVPSSQEELIERVFPPIDEKDLAEPPAADSRMSAPGHVRPFDGALPFIDTITLDSALTTKLIERCRAEHTTVHGAIVAAASRVRSTLRAEPFVRVVTPFNFRKLIGAGGDCADYFTAARTGMVPHDGGNLWDQARTVSKELAGARSAAGVAAISAAVRKSIPDDASAETAEGFVLGGLAYEMLISNVGVLDIAPSGPIHPSAVWGPLLLCQIAGEQVTGIVTYGGRLRMATCSYSPAGAFLKDVRKTLAEACI